MRGRAILAALPSVLREMDEQAAFRIYITDIIAGFVGCKRRYADLISRRRSEPEMTAEEIIESVVRNAGLHEE